MNAFQNESENADRLEAIASRRTIAIISHPDAGKTTLTERLLLLGGAIQLAGTVKGRKAQRSATSDWMAIERARGISVTAEVMQFAYGGGVINLVDTPGHEDFSEDTYRTLTAVDAALMVIDAAKGVEERTRRLMEVCRMHGTPIVTFINKLDRDGRNPLALLDEIEQAFGLACAPVNWPLGTGSTLAGLYDLERSEVLDYRRRQGDGYAVQHIQGEDDPWLQAALGSSRQQVMEELHLAREVMPAFDEETYLAGMLTPVFFGSALRGFGVDALLDGVMRFGPSPRPRQAAERLVHPEEEGFSGFVFKIQANMDPQHRDRIAFLRIVSGTFQRGMELLCVRTGKVIRSHEALAIFAGSRSGVELAYPGDIIGLPNHGTLAVGDTVTEGERLHFTGVPHFAPELFRAVILTDPLKSKALLKGLEQLAEEGALQFFRPVVGSTLVVGAVGPLQFEVAAHRLRQEYGVNCRFEGVAVQQARWVDGPSAAMKAFMDKYPSQLARDAAGHMVYLAPSAVNLRLVQERHGEISFAATRERVGGEPRAA
jgi:peptide chain release factor 3